MVKRLLDKVVVITGATSGIGLEIARLSVSQGANVVISGRRENEGKKIASQLGNNCRLSSAMFYTKIRFVLSLKKHLPSITK